MTSNDDDDDDDDYDGDDNSDDEDDDQDDDEKRGDKNHCIVLASQVFVFRLEPLQARQSRLALCLSQAQEALG